MAMQPIAARFPVDEADERGRVFSGNPGAAGRGTTPEFAWEEGSATVTLADIGWNESADKAIAQLVVYSQSFDDNVTRATSVELLPAEARQLAKALTDWARGK